VLELLAFIMAVIFGALAIGTCLDMRDVALFVAIILFAIYLAIVRCARHLEELTRSASAPGPSRTSQPGSPPAAE